MLFLCPKSAPTLRTCYRTTFLIGFKLLLRHDFLEALLICFAGCPTFFKSLLAFGGTLLQLFFRESRTAGFIIIRTIGSMVSVHAICFATIVGMTRSAAATATMPVTTMMATTVCPTAVTIAGMQSRTQAEFITSFLKPLQIGLRQFLHLFLIQIITLGHIQSHHFGTQLQPLFGIITTIVLCHRIPNPHKQGCQETYYSKFHCLHTSYQLMGYESMTQRYVKSLMRSRGFTFN